MKHQFFKAYSFLFYFLAFITSFFIGLSYAGYIEAGKGQMLAGGAIVLGYGVIGAFIGLVISIFVVSKVNRKTIIRLNIILALCIAAFFLYYHLKYKERQKAKELEKQKIEQRHHNTSTEVKDVSYEALQIKNESMYVELMDYDIIKLAQAGFVGQKMENC